MCVEDVRVWVVLEGGALLSVHASGLPAVSQYRQSVLDIRL